MSRRYITPEQNAQAMREMREAATKDFPKMVDTDTGPGEWWCPTCLSYVSARSVTHEERHGPCEGALEWIPDGEPRPDRPQDDPFERRVFAECQKRHDAAERGEACPRCWHQYPAPTDHVESVTCGACGFVHQFRRNGSVCHACDGTGITGG